MTDRRKPPLPGQALCAACSAPLYWARQGKRPKRCPSCATNAPRRKPGTRLYPLMEQRSPRARAEARRANAARSTLSALSEYAVLRTAIGIGIVGEHGDELAAAIAGGVMIDDPACDTGARQPTRAEAIALAERARGEDYAALREGRASAPAQLLVRFISRGAVSLLEHEASMSASMRPQAVYLAHKALEGMGGGKLAWPQVKLTFEITSDDDDDTPEEE